MNLYDVIKNLLSLKKSMAQLEAGKYVFEVDTRALNFWSNKLLKLRLKV